MQKNRIKNALIMSLLVVGLVLLLSEIGQYLINYYTGPLYIVDQYVEALNERKYDEIYPLLNKDSLHEVGGLSQVTHYYIEYYSKDYRLIKVNKRGWLEDKYILSFQFQGCEKKQALTLVKEKGRWRINFPFETSEVTVKAPNGSRVFLGNEALSYEVGKGYKKDCVLPGAYMVKVILPDASYRDYYKMIRVPEDKVLSLPYEAGNLMVDCASGLKVGIEPLEQISTVDGASFQDVLTGKYKLTITHPYGYLEPITKEIDLKPGDNYTSARTYKLSNAGEKKLGDFLNTFYDVYEQGIREHSYDEIEKYFSEEHKKAQISLFSEWFIQQKNIIGASIYPSHDHLFVDEKGNLHSMIIENIELINLEYNQIEEKNSKQIYKVILYWDTTLNIQGEKWQVMNREIKQSMIAFKDLEGKWVQY